MNVLALVTQFNAEGKKDADEFRREAAAFCRWHHTYDPGAKTRIELIDNTAPRVRRRGQVLQAIDDAGKTERIDCLAFFCHGWAAGLQLGIFTSEIRDVAPVLAARLSANAKIPLYACSTAHGGCGGNGGFADRLRDILAPSLTGVVVDAHVTKGHCTRNPHVRRFAAPAGKGGQYLVAQMSPKWTAWKQALRSDGAMRFRFPFMSADEIAAEL